MPEPPPEHPDPLIAKAIHMAVMVHKLEKIADDALEPVREAIEIRIEIGRSAIRNALRALSDLKDDPPDR